MSHWSREAEIHGNQNEIALSISEDAENRFNNGEFDSDEVLGLIECKEADIIGRAIVLGLTVDFSSIDFNDLRDRVEKSEIERIEKEILEDLTV